MVVAEFASAAALATFSKTVAQSAISEAELEKMILQADRLADFLRKRLSYLKAGDATISAPSPFSLLPSIDELCLVIDHLDDHADALCAAMVCKAFNKAVQRGLAESSELRKRDGIGSLINSFSASELGQFLSSPKRLHWARDVGLTWDAKVCGALALSGRLDTLQAARAASCPWDHCASAWAVSTGRLDVVEWAAANGCPGFEPGTHGNGEQLTQLFEHAASGEFVHAASGEKHELALAMLRWLADWASCRHSMSLAYICTQRGVGADAGGVLERAVGAGNVRAVRWLHAGGGWTNFETSRMWREAVGGPVEMVRPMIQCLRECGLEYDTQACASAAHSNLGGWFVKPRSDFDLLRSLREDGCPWDEDTSAAAARSGDLAMLMFVRAGGCPWDGSAVAAVVDVLGSKHEHSGHRDVLQYLLANDCELHGGVAATAASNGDIPILFFVYNHPGACRRRTPRGK